MRAVGYIRVSTSYQVEDGVSLEAQRVGIERYCEVYQHRLIEVVADEGLSAKTLDRPGMQRVLEMVREKQVDCIVVAKLDRLTRTLRDFLDLVEVHFEPAGVSLQSIQEKIDTQSATGRLLLNFIMSLGQWEREQTSERTKQTLSVLRSQGVMLGGLPYGIARSEDLDSNGRRILIPVPEEIATVQLVLSLREQGHSYASIQRELVQAEIPTKTGGRWHRQTVKNICRRGYIHERI